MLKAGGDIRRIRDDLVQGNNNAAAGQFYYEENQTSEPGAASYDGAVRGQANDVASLFLMFPTRLDRTRIVRGRRTASGGSSFSSPTSGRQRRS